MQSLSLDLVKDSQTVEDKVKEIFPRLNSDQRRIVLEQMEDRARQKARNNFYTYVRLMAPHILPDGFIDGTHISIMCNELQKVERAVSRNKPKRLNIAISPGSMKSKLANLFVSWCLGRHPNWFILHIGHGTQFVEDNAGRPIRDFIRTPEYKLVFPYTELKPDSRASGRWETTEKGVYYAAGAEAQIAGRRAHLVICDDVISEQTAMSEITLKRIRSWYVPGVRSRLLPSGSEIHIGTRWRLDDLSGYLIDGDKNSKIPWKIVSIPAIISSDKESEFLKVPLVDLNDEQKNALGGMKRANSYWPQFWPLDLLLQKKLDPGLTEARWNALYMQTPVPEEGNIVKEQDFKLWKESEPPPLDYIIVTMDTAFSTKTSADFSAYGVWGIFNKSEKDIKGREFFASNLILLECGKGRWEYPDLMEKTHEIYDVYKPDTIVIEKKASGQSLIQDMRRRGLPVSEYMPDKDKLSRAHACTPMFKAGRIWIPEGQGWARELVTEVTQFPYGPYDDYLDVTTEAILFLRDMFALGNPDYLSEKADKYDETEEGKKNIKKRTTYWSLVEGRN